jgi:hypothetical protein
LIEKTQNFTNANCLSQLRIFVNRVDQNKSCLVKEEEHEKNILEKCSRGIGGVDIACSGICRVV